MCTHTVAAHWQSGKVLLFPPAVNDTRRALSLYDRWLFPSTLVPLTGSCGQTAALEAAAVQFRITQQVTNTLPHSAASNFLPTHPPTKSTGCHWLDRSGAALQSLQPVCHFLLLRHTLPPQKPLFCISTSERGRLCFASLYFSRR